MLTTENIKVLGAILTPLSFLLLWLTIYMFRSVIVTVERLERKSLGSGGILVALPLILVMPVITAYYLLTTGMRPSGEIAAAGFATLFIASLLALVPLVRLILLGKRSTCPCAPIVAYIAIYMLANAYFLRIFPPVEALTGLLYIGAELMLGVGLLLLSFYTAGFRNVKERIMDKEFTTHYELASGFLIAAILIPLGATIRAFGLYEIYMERASPEVELPALVLLSGIFLTIAGILGLVSMTVFKRLVENFYLRVGSLSALRGKK